MIKLQKPDSHDFVYSAYAQSIGAILHKPLPAFLTDGPSAALPISGGLISRVQEDIHFNIGTSEIMRVKRASAKVSGERADGYYISLATATIERLNILDVVTADRVVAKVTSLFPVDPKEDLERGDSYPSRFFISGSYFDNLKIDGKPYDCPREEKETPNGFRIKRGEASRGHIFDESCRAIPVEQFGIIYLGEIFKYGGKVILSMFRAELGCPDGGTVPGPTACTNGSKGLKTPGS